MADVKMLTGDAKLKLVRLINEGMQVLQEMDGLREGLNDTVKAIGEELEIKPALLKKAITIAHKASLTQTNQDHDLVVDILEATGKTL